MNYDANFERVLCVTNFMHDLTFVTHDVFAPKMVNFCVKISKHGLLENSVSAGE